MNKMKLTLTVLIGVFLILGAGCAPNVEPTAEAGVDPEGQIGEEGHTDDEDHADDDHMGEDGSEMMHLHIDPPEEFAGLANPLAESEAAHDAGKLIFDTSCATCHGETGMGDGPAAEALDPKPASLADGMMMADLSDGYLFWRVTAGGNFEPFNSAMPSWEALLTEQERWEVISYVRTLSNNDGEGHMDESDDMHGEEQDDDHDN